jgi:p-aminobenzoyl-glutamate transporter AbgT
MNYINSLPDGWTIYIWLIAGAMIVVAVIFAIRWAIHNDQFDEDIKYLVFDKDDEDKMTKAEFAKSQQVLKEQMVKREHFLAIKDKDKKAHDRS